MHSARRSGIAKTIGRVFPTVLAVLALVACGKSGKAPSDRGLAAHIGAVPSHRSSPTLDDARAALKRNDYKDALSILAPLASGGNLKAQVLIGFLYQSGYGVRQDYAEALRWYRRAANHDSPEARRSIGFMYESGLGVAQDYVAALNWYSRAARQGDAGAQFLLGGMYEGAEGVEQNNLLAEMWFSIAASSSDTINSSAAKYRDELSSKLTKAELLEAQTMARICQQSNFAKCDAVETESGGTSADAVPMLDIGGVYTVPVSINGAVTINFIVDSGASEVSIPADVVLTLVRTGTLDKSDFLGSATYTLADGSTTPSDRFRIRSLRVGNLTLENVVAGVGNVESVPLLGQSFLGRFTAWSIDNDRHALLLKGSAGAEAQQSDAGPQNAPAAAASLTDSSAASPREQIRARALQYFDAWSDPNNAGLLGLRSYYAPSITYYGAPMSLDELMAAKLAFAQRWPIRRYTVRPTSLIVGCSSDTICKVTGILDWEATSLARKAHSAGSAQFEFQFTDGLIDQEDGAVLSRAVAKTAN